MEQLEYMVDKPWCFGRDNQFNQFEFMNDPWVFVNTYEDDYIYITSLRIIVIQFLAGAGKEKNAQ